ncbi:MAG: (S)-3-O-geranylgeranylglyceryl phosphate synthase TIM-barrel fold PcrB [Candidatus Methanohalarchaeum thermophilum]|uniref:Geranylgeranylglyceryl phosphate synthase n=1 Tax=Methanohalarchaeum thermophilum TaxID=1903181 RepID=A0A1Q6DW61_METT1|nr:MAG: (S)-3-O-geranylgeranylglyceryl phosphate synthase TIM-barrel fold PcrB [Candidatus Methanohalarchaeum thermophilum]
MNIEELLDKEKTQHLSLIDPDEQSPSKVKEIASEAEKGGTDAFMVGGSLVKGESILDKTVEAIKKTTELPVILFPQDHSGLTPKADAVFFMSLLNSRESMYTTGFQMRGAPLIKKFDLEVLPMAYLIVEPGGTVGYIGDAKEIPREKPEIAVAYSLAGQYMGMDYIYLEAGSGANKPVPPKMVKAVKENIDANLIVGGGIRNPKHAKAISKAGADFIVTGTAIETKDNIKDAVSSFKERIC